MGGGRIKDVGGGEGGGGVVIEQRARRYEGARGQERGGAGMMKEVLLVMEFEKRILFGVYQDPKIWFLYARCMLRV